MCDFATLINSKIESCVFMPFTIRILCAILCLAFAGASTSLWAQESILDKKISLNVKETKVEQILQEISQLSGAKFAYDKRKIPLQHTTTIVVKNKSLQEILILTFKDTNVEFKAIGQQISLFRTKLPRYTISGYLKDKASGEALIGGNVYESIKYRGTTTNVYGFYSLTLPEGNYILNWTYLGFQTKSDTISLTQNTRKNIYLNSDNTLKEIVVTPKVEQKIEDVQITSSNSQKVEAEEIESVPNLMGELDVLRLVSLFPGIQTGSDGSRGISVRGGGSDQNLVLLDGVPVYNVYHLFGLISVFNSEAINTAEIIKSGFPARYGGRLSSVLDIRMKEGNLKQFHGGLSIGAITSGLHLEGPIIKDKTSFFISARRTWLDLLLRTITSIASPEFRTGYGFYDVNAKINHQISNKHRLYFSYFMGNDGFFSREIQEDSQKKAIQEYRRNWGNKIAALRWNTILGPKLFSNTTLTYSNYGYGFQNYANPNKRETDPSKINEFDFKSISRIDDFGLRYDIDYIPNNKHYVRAGGSYTFHNYHPANNRTSITQQGVIDTLNIKATPINSHEFYAFIEDDYLWHKQLKINHGLHIAGMSVKSNTDKQYQTYITPQYRINTQWNLKPQHTLSASYAGTAQFIHLLTEQGVGFQTDLWVPSTKNIKPELSHLFTLDYSYLLRNKMKITLGGYYKKQYRLLEFQEGASFVANGSKWEDFITIGQGASFGGEILLSKPTGKLTGWLSYTLSWANRKFEELNGGLVYPYDFDRRHFINAVLNYKFGKRVDIGAVWSFGTGNPTTLSLERYRPLGVPFPIFTPPSYEIFDYSEKNNYRMPNYHRLDLSMNMHKATRLGTRTWRIGLINVYNRKNPFSIYPASNSAREVQIRKLSLLPIPLPYATYSFKF